MQLGAQSDLGHRIRIDQLPALYRELGRALIQKGALPAQAAQVLEGQISIHCSECGMPIEGKEFAKAAVIEPNEAENQKIARLSLGYCARRECRSYYGEVHLEVSSDTDWPDIWRAAEHGFPAAGPTVGDLDRPNSAPSMLGAIVGVCSLRGIILTASAVAVLFVLFWWICIPPAYSKLSPEYRSGKVVDSGEP